MTFVQTWAVPLARALNAAFCFASATYCLLCVSPFAYEQFIRPQLIAWLPDAIARHAQVFWVSWLLTLITLWPDLQRRRWLPSAYVVGAAACGAWLTVTPVMATVGLDGRGTWLVFLWCGLVLALAVVDHARSPAPAVIPTDEGHLLRVCGLSALAMWALSAVAVPWRLRALTGLEIAGDGLLVALLTSLIAHLVVAVGQYLVLTTGTRIAALTRSAVAEYWIVGALASCAVAWVLEEQVLAAISVEGEMAWLVAISAAVAMVLMWSSLVWHLSRTVGRQRRAPASCSVMAVDAWLAPSLLAVPALAVMLSSRLSQFDWNFLLQRIAVLVSWIAITAWVSRRLRGRRIPAPRRLWLAVPVVAALTLVAITGPLGRQVAAWNGDARLRPEFLFDHYAALDPSFRTIRDLVRTSAGDASDLYAFLKAHSTIARRDIRPIDIDFVPPTEAARPGRRRPDVYVIVVDSLRRDYLSPYNPEVTFTPGIARLAADGVVFERAFTRYGATGLSMPAMWAGGLLIHKQYVTPFHAMNALEKLIDRHGYRRVMSRDHITSALFRPSTDTHYLDDQVPEIEHALCRTLDALGEIVRNDRPASHRKPLFFMTRPLELHMAALAKGSPTPRGVGIGFYPPYAHQLELLDACLGSFIDLLEREGRYDESVVILTSDHGESLGEEGRWGHAYTLFPEVVSVPLIVRLPPWLREMLTTDVTRVSLSTDITPTLYALLGETPADLGRLYGSPLFVDRRSALPTRHDAAYLLSSSYGAVYGLIADNGRRLYIADAIAGRDYQYDLANLSSPVRMSITEGVRRAAWTSMREQIGELASLYAYSPLR